MTRRQQSISRALRVPALLAALAGGARAQSPACDVTSYCSSTPNSTGAAAVLATNGDCVLELDDFVLTAAPVPNQFGIFFYAAGPTNGGAGVPFGNGLRCVGNPGAPARRLPVTHASGGMLVQRVELAGGPITPGSTWYFQAWFRDPAAGGASFDLSDALSVTFQSGVALSSDSLDFGSVDVGESVALPLTLWNGGSSDAAIDEICFLVRGSGANAGHDFRIEIGGEVLEGDHDDACAPSALSVPAGGHLDALVTFEPSEPESTELELRFDGDFGSLSAAVRGDGLEEGHEGFLHVVMDHLPALVVDYDGDGVETVDLLGSDSHTHEPGRVIAAWEWRESGVLFSTDADTTRTFALGEKEIELTIYDDDAPPDSLSDTMAVAVYPPQAVPGLLALYYDASGVGAGALLHAVPSTANYVERLETPAVPTGARVGGSPFTRDVMVRFVASFDSAGAATWEFVATGGADRVVEVDGQDVTGPLPLAAGPHALEARFAVDTLFDLPLSLSALVDGRPIEDLGAELAHDESSVPPLIHSMPQTGTEAGGNFIAIEGFGFFPADQVTVHWGAVDLVADDFQSLAPERIELSSPPGTGVIQVRVETPSGTSNALPFTYSPDGPVPIRWNWVNDYVCTGATCGEWGPDGRLYVGTISGVVRAFTFDPDYHLLSSTSYPGVSALSNNAILGLAFDPFSPPGTVEIFVAHSQLFQATQYTGRVSKLTGPNFDAPVPIVTGLPSSNHDHAVNGMEFDENGDLLICAGSNTNAGVPWPQSGNLPESPLSAAILKAELSRPDFDGALHYVDSTTGLVDDDETHGDRVDLAPGKGVHVHASGVRNSFDLAYTTWGALYATDNGPDAGFGPGSTGPTTDGGSPHPDTTLDEILLVESGNYYGHPNRNRGRYDSRQNVYYGPNPASIPGVFTQWIGQANDSLNGLVEYRASSFGGQLRGNLFAQRYGGHIHRIVLGPDRRSVQSVTQVTPQVSGLGITTAPGGALVTLSYTGNSVRVLIPDDDAAIGLCVYDVFPWRAPSTGGQRFVVGGEGFGTLANTQVFFDGVPAQLTSVGSRRIVGTVPPHAPTSSLVDLRVRVGADQRTLPAAFSYLFATPGHALGHWTQGADLPVALGEVAGGVLGGTLVLVGDGGSQTLGYDLLHDAWTSALAPRPNQGDHHAAEVIGGKLYLVGGFANGSTGRVQIYDPAADAWSHGADMPWWGGGSIQTCAIGGRIYACGGIVNNGTVEHAAVYDPATDAWSDLPDMPVGVNHAAAATDGARMWIFGGRQGDNLPQPGLDLVQVFDPQGNAWDSSSIPGSTLAPMPSGRGGTGKAIWYQGEFYVFGGETSDANDPEASPGGVFAQVQVYDPLTNAWRLDAPMPTARHGIFPLLFQGRMFVAGGGTQSGHSSSTTLGIFTRQ